MRRILVVLATAVAVGTVGFVGVALVDPETADAAKLRNFTKTDTALQSGFAGTTPNNAQINDPNDPFSYSGVRKIARITQVTITATLFDADTVLGQGGDENNLTLALDGIDTGIKLNGFGSDVNDTRTITGTPINRDAILAALKADGKLQASIKDATAVPGNFVRVSSTFQTTLTIEGKQRR